MTNAARKFYKAAAAMEHPDGFAVALDGRVLRAPGGGVFITPTRALAAACAAEWDAQGESIAPITMPLTRLCNVAIERTPHTHGAVAGHVGSYAETDLVSHRAQAPASLVARQAGAWDPLIAWMDATYAVRLPVVTGIAPAPVEERMRRRVEEVADGLDDFRLTGLAHTAGLAGSAAIAFALMHNRLDARTAFDAACLDDLFGLETWGEDELARERLANIFLEFQALQRFFQALE